MAPPLRILILEDVPADAELEIRELRAAGLEFTALQVETRDAFLAALEEFRPDVIISDYRLPTFDGVAALRLVLEKAPETPFIITTGSLDEETAVDCMKAGAWDYVLKDRLSRLPLAVRGALELATTRRERARADDALRRNQEDLAEAQRLAKLGSWRLHIPIDHVTWSDELCRIFGVDPDAFGGTYAAFLERVHPDDRARVLAVNALARNDAQPFSLEYRIVTPAGETKTVREIGTAVTDPAGLVVGLLGTVQDVTERRRTDEALRESEQRYRLIAENTADVIWTLDLATQRFTYVSPSVTKLKGFTPEEVLSRPFLDAVMPEYAPLVQAKLAASLAAIAAGDPSASTATMDLEEPTKDGGVVPTEVVATALRSATGELTGILGVTRDRRQRKRAEEALAHERNRFSALLENAPFAMVMVKGERFEYVNRPFVQLTGYAHEEVADFGAWRERAYPDLEYRRAVAEDWSADSAAEPRGRTREREFTITCKDGTRKVCHFVSTPLDEDEFLLALEDITERRTAELALRESEQRYRGLFEQSPIGIYRTTPDGRILLANPALLRMLEYETIEQLLARNLETTGFEPDYPREDFKAILARDGELRDFETEWTTRTGRRVRVIENARAIRGGDGRILYYEGAVEDITARKAAEEALRRLATAVEQAAEAVMIADPSGRIEYVSPAFERITGYSAAEAIGQTPNLLRSGRHDAAFYRAMWDAITSGQVWSGHLVNRRKDGTTYEEEMTISPVRDPRGRIVNFVAVKRDVTQEAALREQLNQAQKMEAIGRLAGGIAHDFNNLLQALLTDAQLLRAHAGDPGRIRTEAAELEQHVGRGAALTRQLLLFSRRETSRVERLDLSDVARTAAKMLRRLVRENVSFDLELAERPVSVEADRGQIEQVLMNLVVNASDAMEEGGRLVIRTGGAGNGTCWLEVEDTGHGIPEPLREHIFEPFFTTKGAGKGTGLGLSVVHGIVTQHGGSVELETREGHGSRFRVVLPRAGSGGFAPVSKTAAAADGLPLGTGERVLVVEDEPGARDGLKEILVSLGYDVVAVGSGAEAGRLPAEPGFAVLLTDLLLPDVAGNELAAGLQERWPGLAVILMSGYAEDDAVRHGIEAGQIRFLQKPFDMQTLAGALRAALGG